MKLSQLQYFQIICKYQNMTRAADVLYISQPSLSASIKALEDEFGVTLFRRLNKGIELTDAGIFLQKRCNEILSLTDSLTEEMRPFRKNSPQLHIGVPPMLCNTIFPNLYQDFQQRFPNVEISVEVAGSSSVLSLLKDGVIDVALISFTPDPAQRNYGGIRIGSIEIVCYMSAHHLLAGRSFVTLEDIRDLPLVDMSKDTYISQYVEQVFRQMKATPNVIMRINHLRMIESLISGNRAIALLYDNLLELSADIVKKSLCPPHYAGVEVVWIKRERMQPSVEHFLDFISTYHIG